MEVVDVVPVEEIVQNVEPMIWKNVIEIKKITNKKVHLCVSEKN